MFGPDYHIHCQRAIWKDTIDLFVGLKQADGSVLVAKPIDFEAFERGASLSGRAPLIELGTDIAQRLMDELWHCGVRPSRKDAATTDSAFEAQGRHLEDMRSLVFKGKYTAEAERAAQSKLDCGY